MGQWGIYAGLVIISRGWRQRGNWDRSRSDGGVNASVMGDRGCDDRWRAMAYGLSQSGLSAGLGLELVGSIERDSGLTAMATPIAVVVTPVKGRSVQGTISLNQSLFDKVVAIELCVAKLVT